MTLFKRAPFPDREVIELQERALKAARVKRRAAIWDLLESIADVPVEKGIEQVGREMGRRRPDDKS